MHAQYKNTIIFCLILISQTLAAKQVNHKPMRPDLAQITQAKDIQKNIEENTNPAIILQSELQKNESSTGYMLFDIKQIEKQLQEKNRLMIKLRNAEALYTTQLKKQKIALAKQIRVAYMTGGKDYIKLLLNQENPSKMDRGIAYHEYLNQARESNMQSTISQINVIKQLKKNIEHERTLFKQLKQEKIAKNNAIDESRNKRKAILQQLNNTSKNTVLELTILQEETKQLLRRLLEDNKPSQSNTTSFKQLKGNLDWPIKGKLLNRFGGYQENGILKWQGVVIKTDYNEKIQAISSGQVVFADWFKNFGLLMIIDHGENYMSLYGYNQSLLKKTGDLVLPGEVIALSGDSGGQSDASVYFEIRNHGQPVNPMQWCRNN